MRQFERMLVWVICLVIVVAFWCGMAMALGLALS